MRNIQYAQVSAERADDVARMHSVLTDAGYEVSGPDLERLWGDYSDESSASWLFLPDDNDELLSTLLSRLPQVGHECSIDCIP